MADTSLDPEKIIAQIERLSRRIQERFPDSGLYDVSGHLIQISQRAKERAEWISNPIIGLRIATWALVILFVVILVWLLAASFRLDLPAEFNIFEAITILEASINDLIFVGAAIFFFVTLESRIKRRRALAAIHELRSIAHIIDMHQLTKDPERVRGRGRATPSSPSGNMTPFELSRYFDFCSEMLSLTGKVAALFVQKFDDPVVLDSVREVELLTTGLSRKIWQKSMILHTLGIEDLVEDADRLG